MDSVLLRIRCVPANGHFSEVGLHLSLRSPMSKASTEVRLKVTGELR